MGNALSARYLKPEDIKPSDYITFVVGSAGVGKSTFINTAVGGNILSTGHSAFISSTHDIQQVACSIPTNFLNSGNQRLVFVEIPALELDSGDSNTNAVDKLGTWLRSMTSRKLEARGIIYLQRITGRTCLGSPKLYLGVLKKLYERYRIQSAFPKRMVLVTTMWGSDSTKEALRREEDLGTYLNDISRELVLPRIFRFKETFGSAWSIVCDLLEGVIYSDPALPESAKSLYSPSNWSADPSTPSEPGSSVEPATPSEPQLLTNYNFPSPIIASPGVKDGISADPPISVTGPYHDDNTEGMARLSLEIPAMNTHPKVQKPPHAEKVLGKPQPSSLTQQVTSPAEYPRRSRALIMGIGKAAVCRAKILKLTGEDAQQMVDFINTILHEKDILNTGDGTFLLTVLRKLAKTACVIPRCYELSGIQCDSDMVQQGGFADIYQGQYKNQRLCLKILRLYSDQNTTMRSNIKELTVWAHLLHPNVLPFYGVFLYGSTKRTCLVSPWMNQGNLAEFLKRFPERPRFPMVFDIIDGLSYLHQRSIVHGDLKSQNVLLRDDGRALLADFGLARIAMITHIASSTGLANGTTRWKAPELFPQKLADEALPTRESDIWSFGCLCYEVFTRRIPFYDYTDMGVLRLHIDRKAIQTKPPPTHEGDRFDDRVWKIMTDCWNYEPPSRPNCDELRCAFTEIQDPGDRPRNEDHQEDNRVLWEEMRSRSDIHIDYRHVYETLLRIQENA
ncbi:kinase-like protein [Macrolepiota fuliginosa MF-IS2]|uniref:Kinase-like protein n=1 Tax=Macrolepiota fuliginosa MF-IS2 TaxID=1400762 RepID=A0A9P6C830_9AGAR|nr:kinase-like protein [Macrolepiota fuliginosa MF-IS2]